jgi:hypothetical protein
LLTCQFVFEGENTWPCSAEAAKRVLEFQGHQAAYDLTPALGVALCPFLQQLAIVAFAHTIWMIAYSQAPGTGEEGMQQAQGVSTLPGKAKRGSTKPFRLVPASCS